MIQHPKPLKLPIGIQDFADIREEGYLYVDKTAPIFDLLTTGKYYFLSRPRRFGKSLTLSVIKYLYGGRRDLFAGLWIEPQWDWNKTHPVLHISFSDIGYKTLGLEAALLSELQLLSAKWGIELREEGIARQFRELLRKLAEKHGKVVLLVDEYDKPLIDFLDEPEKAKAHQQLLKAFYATLKDSGTHIEFLLLTGVSKFSQVSIFSDLNHLKDITLHPRFVTLTGYTQQEVGQHFGERIAELATTGNRSIEAQTALIRDWYNGYSWGQGVTLYNPFSLMSYLDAGQFNNYWFSTGTPTFLLKLMRKKWIYDINAIELSELAFSSYDVEDLQVYPILFQTGYLTIKGRNEFGLYCMGYPNREVQESMLMYLISNVAQDESSMSKTMVLQIRAAFYQNDMESLIRLINSIFKNIPSHIFIAEAEAYYHSLIFLVFFYLGQYAESEVDTNNERLDCVVKTDKHIYVIEFKLNQSAKVALQQIKDKSYAEKYLADSRQKVLLGVNFSSEDKAVKDWLVDGVA